VNHGAVGVAVGYGVGAAAGLDPVGDGARCSESHAAVAKAQIGRKTEPMMCSFTASFYSLR